MPTERRPPPPPSLREYRLDGGFVVLVGRTDADNERLSLEVAEPDDWWFHVRGMPGSHVVLRAGADAEPGRATLEAAAAIAAWHSKARAGGRVAVSCTRARHVRKPRGAPRGTVEIAHERVLQVRPGLPAGADEDAAAGDDPGAGTARPKRT